MQGWGIMGPFAQTPELRSYISVSECTLKLTPPATIILPKKEKGNLKIVKNYDL